MIQKVYKASDGKEFDTFVQCIEYEFDTNEVIKNRYPFGVAVFNKYRHEIELDIEAFFKASIMVIFDYDKAKEFFAPFIKAGVNVPKSAGVFVINMDYPGHSRWAHSSDPVVILADLMHMASMHQ